MGRQISLVKSKKDAFTTGLMAEFIDELQRDSSQFDSFIVTEPGCPARKVPDGLITHEVLSVSHRYSNIQGIIDKILNSDNYTILGKPQDAHYFNNGADTAAMMEEFRFNLATETMPARVSI